MEKRIFLLDVINSWNSHDLDRILSHYNDDFELISVIIKDVFNVEDGTIRTKENVRKWWRRVLDNVPDIHFEFLDISESVDSTALIYKSSYGNKIVVSIFNFDEKGLIAKEVFFQ